MKPAAREIFSDPAHLLAFGFGTGLSPFAPGTVGTLVTIPLVWATWNLPLPLRAGICLLLILAGIWAGGASARKLGVHDHGGIVIDEVAGFYLAMLLLPAGWWWMLAAFVAFRFFDIAKPWPIGFLDRRLGGGAGIMIDDLVAGVFAAATLQLAYFAWMFFL
ncbi:MAG TPA: phosphatidylglycerophosphatase A [Gammaproteobacteria bacterium]